MIDAAVAGFDYHPERHVLTPLMLKRVWKKAEIVALYNERTPAGAPPYAPNLATPQADRRARRRAGPRAPAPDALNRIARAIRNENLAGSLFSD